MSEHLEILSGAKHEALSALYARPAEITSVARRKTLVIMVHDFPGSNKEGHEDFYGDLEYLFLHLGFHTLRFDFRGCGHSDGKTEDFRLASAMEDFQSVLVWAEEKKFEHLIYVGEGLGAAIALQNLQGNVEAMLMFWPALNLPALAAERFKSNAGGAGHKIGSVFLQELQNADLKPSIAKTDIPMLVQHGTQDDVIPITHLDFLKKHTKARRLDVTSYQGGDHGLNDEKHRKMVFYHVGQFIEKYT